MIGELDCPAIQSLERLDRYEAPKTWKVKVKFALELAMNAQKGSKGIALLFF